MKESLADRCGFDWKASPLELLSCCSTILEGGAVRPLSEADRARIRAEVDGFATEDLRTLAFARKELAGTKDSPAMGGLEILLCLVYIPFFQGVFGLVPLALKDWAFIAAFPFVMLFCEEARKWIARRLEHRRTA